MKNKASLLLTLILSSTFVSLTIQAQTYVSGGIYSNTNWTAANSPYIVVDTVVVFPGVKLTVQPGVVVKFYDNTRLEIRQGTLIANGTSTDSITFTSNSTPTQLNWQVYLNNDSSSNFNYNNFSYSNQLALRRNTDANNTALIIKNSKFLSNYYGAYIYNASAYIDSCFFKLDTFALYAYGGCTINNCIISNNINGITPGYSTLKNSLIDSNNIGIIAYLTDSVINCEISNNYIGIKNVDGVGDNVFIRNSIENNSYGFFLYDSPISIHCNKICNNTMYNIYYSVLFNNNLDASNNYWCTTDSAIIENKIYDGYDNINLGLVNFMPFDTLQCYLSIGIPLNTFNNLFINVFPNPASDYLNVSIPTTFSKTEIKIFNMLGEIEYSYKVTCNLTKLDISNLTCGVHIIQIVTGENISRQKFIKK